VAPPPPPPPEPETTTTTTLLPGQVPPEIQALIDAYPRTPAGSTTALVAALDQVDPAERHLGFGRFPVAGLARWSHDWLFPRHTPSFHTHEGTDVFAHRGTAVISPAAGVVDASEGAIGGLAVKVTQDDGTYWYLSHLDTVTVADGDVVVPGHIVGTVGDSGNAKGGAPHVHVEVHPYGGGAVDPKRILDAYYAEALAAAPDVVRYLGVWVRPVRLYPLPDDVVIDVTPDSPETAAS
jgi:murein DD-endopeptidase MepM/ murein hydrolase activator NlpD